MKEKQVAAIHNPGADYPEIPPFHPSVAYPEYPFDTKVTGIHNAVYDSVRECLRLIGLDKENFESPGWNPFGSFIFPGDRVAVKPNMVRDYHDSVPAYDSSLTTHGSVVRAVIDYVSIALKGRGSIVIADSSQNDADHGNIVKMQGLDEIQTFYDANSDIKVGIEDLRPERVEKIEGLIVRRIKLKGDPEGYTVVDLGGNSSFGELDYDIVKMLLGAESMDDSIREWHTGDRHAYQVCNTFLKADVVINLPKMKTHKKSGITVCLKGLIGILGDKTIVPHCRKGHPASGGDQFAESRFLDRAETFVSARFHAAFRKLGPARKLLARSARHSGNTLFGMTDAPRIRSGNWHGNDTIWRTVLDLARILIFADKCGRFSEEPGRRCFFLVDGIIGGEGNGPLAPTPKNAGVILAGFNPVAVDIAAARLMGFDPMKIKMLKSAVQNSNSRLVDFDMGEVDIQSNNRDWEGEISRFTGKDLDFTPHHGWKDWIEAT